MHHNLIFLEVAYNKGDAKDKGIHAIHAFILAGEIGEEIPAWAMHEIGCNLSNYFRENYAVSGYKKLDSFFGVNGRTFQKMRTNDAQKEQTTHIMRFRALYGLSTQQAIKAAEKAGLPTIETDEGLGKEHAFNRTKYAAMNESFKKALANMKVEDVNDMAEHILSELPDGARKYIERHRKK